MFYCTVITWVLIMLTHKTADGRITTHSSNGRVVVGSTVSFECATDSGLDIRWYRCDALGCVKPTVIFNGDELDESLQPRFSVTTTTTSSQLRITVSHLDDSGTYICTEADSFSSQQHFILTVLDATSFSSTPAVNYQQYENSSLFTPAVTNSAAAAAQITSSAKETSSSGDVTIYTVLGLIGLVGLCVVVFATLLIIFTVKKRTAASPVIVQGIGDPYTATATYQHPVVTTIPLNAIAEPHRHTAISPASASTSVNQQIQQQEDETVSEDDQYSEINSQPPSSSHSSSSSSSFVAAAAAMMTSSGHVTETDTPTKQVRDAEAAMYSELDRETMTEPTSLPTVYQTLSDRDRDLPSN